MKNLKYKQSFFSTEGQRGASLLEAIAFLGIAAVVILGAVSLLGGAFSGANINKVSTEIVTMRTNISKLFIGQRTFGANGTALSSAINSANMAPATLSWDSANTRWINAFSGNTIVVARDLEYYLEYTNVPTNACIPLVMTAAGWSWITVNTAVATHTAEATADGSGVYSPTANASRTLPNVTNACDNSNANTIRFYGTL